MRDDGFEDRSGELDDGSGAPEERLDAADERRDSPDKRRDAPDGRRRALDVRRVALAVLVVATTVAFTAGLSTSLATLDPHNYEWNGGSALHAELDDAGGEAVVARSAEAYERVDSESSVAFAAASQSSATIANATQLRRLLDRGGTVVVAGEGTSPSDADEPRANELLAELGAETRIDGTPLRDVNHYHRGPELPRATGVSEHPLVDGVDRLTLNRGSVLDLPGSTGSEAVENVTRTGRATGVSVLVRSSPFGYLDVDGNGRFDERERLGTYPVAAVEPVGDGRVVVVSDSTLFANAMLERDGNRAFARSLAGSGEVALLEYTEGPAAPPLAPVTAALRASPLLGAAVGLLGLLLVGAWLFWPSVRRNRSRSRLAPQRRTGEVAEGTTADGLISSRARTTAAVILVVAGAVLAVAVASGAVTAGLSVPTEQSATNDASHADPSTVNGTVDLGAVERRLGGHVAERARIDDENLSPERIGRTRQALNRTRYRSLLRGYANVLDATGETNRSRAFRRLQRDQLAFVSALDRYWTTHERYIEVRNALDDGTSASAIAVGPDGETVSHPARYLAHRLESRWAAVNDTGSQLVATYEAAERPNRTVAAGTARTPATEAGGAPSADAGSTPAARDEARATLDFTTSMRALNRTSAAASEMQRNVRRAEFVGTTLDVTPASGTVSYHDPLPIRGRLTAANGTAVGNATVRAVAPDDEARAGPSNRSIVLPDGTRRAAVGDGPVQTRTDANGDFELTYRPTGLRANATDLRVEYVPDNASGYAPSAATVNVSVQTVEPDVDVSVEPANVSRGESLRVTGRVGSSQHGGPAVPYLVTIGDRVVGWNATDADGRVDESVTVPADVPDGELTVRVRLVPEWRPLVPVDGETTVRVEVDDEDDG